MAFVLPAGKCGHPVAGELVRQDISGDDVEKKHTAQGWLPWAEKLVNDFFQKMPNLP